MNARVGAQLVTAAGERDSAVLQNVAALGEREGKRSRLLDQEYRQALLAVKTREEIDAVVRAVAPKPVNVVMGLSGPSLSLDALAILGVKRVSLGSSLARAAYGAFLQAAREVREKGTFDFARNAVPYAEINAMFKR